MRMKLSGWKCEACGANQLLQVHHLTYDRIFQEPMEDLMVLCRLHHEAAEEMVKKGVVRRTGCVVRLRTDTLRMIAPMERHMNRAVPVPVRGRKGKKPKRSKSEKRAIWLEKLQASRTWTPEALKKIPPQYHQLTWTSPKEEVLPLLMSDQKFLSLIDLPQRQFRIKYRKMFPKCPPRGRIFAVAGQLWVDIHVLKKVPHPQAQL